MGLVLTRRATQTLTFQEEAFSCVWPEIAALLPAHWQEIALDKEYIPLNMDLGAYAMLERQGILQVVTARVEGETLVGYFITFIRCHLHYCQSLTAFEDMYYLAPAYRRGWNGIRFFQAVEASWRVRGVERAVISFKLHFQGGRVARVLEWLGWRPTERVYTKLLML